MRKIAKTFRSHVKGPIPSYSKFCMHDVDSKTECVYCVSRVEWGCGMKKSVVVGRKIDNVLLIIIIVYFRSKLRDFCSFERTNLLTLGYVVILSCG